MANITDSKYLTGKIRDFNQSTFQSILYLERISTFIFSTYF